MKTFSNSLDVERRGIELLRPLFDDTSDGRYVLTNHGRLSRLFQETVGDVIYNDRAGRMWTVEIKCEEENKHNNFFLEHWSNRNLDNAGDHAYRGSTIGWLPKLQGDLLFYYFLRCDSLYVMNVFGLKRWAFGYGGSPGHIYRYEEKPQGKYSQPNDTWGWCVPIADIMAEVKPASKLIHPHQLDFWPDRVSDAVA